MLWPPKPQGKQASQMPLNGCGECMHWNCFAVASLKWAGFCGAGAACWQLLLCFPGHSHGSLPCCSACHVLGHGSSALPCPGLRPLVHCNNSCLQPHWQLQRWRPPSAWGWEEAVPMGGMAKSTGSDSQVPHWAYAQGTRITKTGPALHWPQTAVLQFIVQFRAILYKRKKMQLGDVFLLTWKVYCWQGASAES